MDDKNTTRKVEDVTERIIDNRNYLVKSIFLGDKDIKQTILKLAERKAISEMGLDNPIS